MSVKAVTWALEQRIKDPRAHLLLINLADFADKDHRCFPGQPLLASRLGRSVDTVQRLLQKLDGLGLIQSGRRNTSQGYRTSNWYCLNVEVSVGLTEPPSSGGGPKPQNHGLGGNPSRNSAEPKPQQRAEPKPQRDAVGTINIHQKPCSSRGANFSTALRAGNFEGVRKKSSDVWPDLQRWAEGFGLAVPDLVRRATAPSVKDRNAKFRSLVVVELQRLLPSANPNLLFKAMTSKGDDARIAVYQMLMEPPAPYPKCGARA